MSRGGVSSMASDRVTWGGAVTTAREERPTPGHVKPTNFGIGKEKRSQAEVQATQTFRSPP